MKNTILTQQGNHSTNSNNSKNGVSNMVKSKNNDSSKIYASCVIDNSTPVYGASYGTVKLSDSFCNYEQYNEGLVNTIKDYVEFANEHTICEFRDICTILDIPSSGKKHELVTRVRHYIEQWETWDASRYSCDNITSTELVTAYIIDNCIYKKLANWAIIKIASQPFKKSAIACNNIINSGFKDEIVNDIYQGVAENILRYASYGFWAINNGNVVIKPEYSDFSGYSVKVERVSSIHYITLRAIEKVLYEYSNKYNNAPISDADILQNILEGVAIEPDFLNNLATSEYIRKFSDYIASLPRVTENSAKIYRRIICLLILGYSCPEIAEKLQLSDDVIQKRRNKLAIMYTKWRIEENKVREKVSKKEVHTSNNLTMVTPKLVKSDISAPHTFEYTGKLSEKQKQFASLSAHDRKQREYERIFGVGGELDRKENDEAYIYEYSAIACDYSRHFEKTENYINVYENDVIVRKYPIKK